MAFQAPDVESVAERVNARLARTVWDTSAIKGPHTDLETAAEVATFALELAGKRRQARKGGRFGRLVMSFAFAACVALASVAAACEKPNATPEETQTAIDALPSVGGTSASVTSQPRGSPALFTDLTLIDQGSDSRPWAVMQAAGSESPILVDRAGSGLDTVGATYRLAGQPVTVGTRDGPSQFLDPLQPAVSTGSSVQPSSTATQQLEARWAQDERYLAPTRAIAGQPTVLDAAYNAAAAASAGGTHTYTNGVVLRVEPDNPVLEVIDRSLLESGAPTRAEDVVYVAIRSSEQSLYNPGQVVNLSNVAVQQQNTDVNGQQTTVYVVNAALDGARVEPTGSVDLNSLLQPRLQRVDQDLSAQAQAAPNGTPAASATATPGATTAPQPQQVIVQQRSGPSFVDDFLIWMWLSNSGWYRGPSVIINNPVPIASRPSDQVYYSPPPTASGSTPSTVASQQAASRSTALEASRSAVSGQAAGTGGGVAATNKSAASTSAQVGAATAKSASVAGQVSASSVGKSISSVPSSSSITASRSAGNTSAGSRGSAGVSSSSSSSGSKGIGGASSSSSSSGGKGISGGSSSSSGSSGGFGGKGIGGSSSS